MDKINHIAISVEGNLSYAKEKNLPMDEVFKKSYKNMVESVIFQIDKNIPILSFILFSRQFKEMQDNPEMLDAYDKAFQNLMNETFIQDHQVKISFMGKWYNLPGKLVERIKAMKIKPNDVNISVNITMGWRPKKSNMARIMPTMKTDEAVI